MLWLHLSSYLHFPGLRQVHPRLHAVIPLHFDLATLIVDELASHLHRSSSENKLVTNLQVYYFLSFHNNNGSTLDNG